jgi:hypothetical protein
MFKELVVPKPKECKQIIVDLHDEIGHFGEGRTLAEMNKRYFCHNFFEDVKAIVHSCK